MNILAARYIPDEPREDPFEDEAEPTPEDAEQRAADLKREAIIQAAIDAQEENK